MFSKIAQTFVQPLHHWQEVIVQDQISIWVVEQFLRPFQKCEEG